LFASGATLVQSIIGSATISMVEDITSQVSKKGLGAEIDMGSVAYSGFVGAVIGAIPSPKTAGINTTDLDGQLWTKFKEGLKENSMEAFQKGLGYYIKVTKKTYIKSVVQPFTKSVAVPFFVENLFDSPLEVH